MDVNWLNTIITTMDVNWEMSSSDSGMFANASHFVIKGGTFTVVSNNDRKEIIDWLKAPDCFANFVAAANKRTPETGNWILDHPIYKKWKRTGDILWIQGKAGSGKTVLSATIYEDLCRNAAATLGPSNVVWSHYFDFRDNTGSKSEYSGFLSNLLQQMGSNKNGIHPVLQELFVNCKKGLGRTRPSDLELKNAIAAIIQELNTGCIVLDALDECSAKDASSVLNWLAQFRNRVWIVVTSRNFPEGKLADIKFRITLDKAQPGMDKDIVTYLNAQMENFANFGNLKTSIMETLTKKAQGQFRWVDCQVNSLLQCGTSKAVRQALQRLPHDLEQTYVQAITKAHESHHKDDAYQLLLWLTYAFEPLNVKQIQDILGIDLEDQVYYKDEMLPKIHIIIDTNLVTVNARGVCQLAHSSVKEFLIDHCRKPTALFKINEKLAHDKIAQGCIIYLFSSQDETLNSGVSEDLPLADYAAYFWPAHAQQVEESDLDSPLHELTKLILEDGSSHFQQWSSQWRRIDRRRKRQTVRKQDDIPAPNPIYYAAQEGLLRSVQDIILSHGKECINHTTVVHGNSLQAAASKGYTNIVAFLLENGADVHAQGGRFGNAIQAASETGNCQIVRMLLEKGADVNVQGGYYGNALQAASARGHIDVATFLLQKGADVNAQGGFYGNALQAASDSGNTDIASLLIENGANVHAEGGEFHNALQAAASNRSMDVIKLLVEKGADVCVQGGDFGNALQAAASRGGLEIVLFLVENGADVNAQGGYYGNALQAASETGHIDIVTMLLERGADPNAYGGRYGTALQAASSRGHIDIVMLLMDNGALVNTTHGGEYGNAFQAAITNHNDAIATLLLQKGADVNAQGGFYGNPLQSAIYTNHELLVIQMLEKNVNVNTQGGYFGNALQAASFNGSMEIVTLLLEKGADVNAKGGNYGCAIEAALDQGYSDIVAILLEKGADLPYPPRSVIYNSRLDGKSV